MIVKQVRPWLLPVGGPQAASRGMVFSVQSSNWRSAATKEELLGTVFSVQPFLRLYNEELLRF
jgi:hypothetical protein